MCVSIAFRHSPRPPLTELDLGAGYGRVSIAFRHSPRPPQAFGLPYTTFADWLVSIAFRHSPRPPRERSSTWLYKSATRLHCLSAFTASTTLMSTYAYRIVCFVPS